MDMNSDDIADDILAENDELDSSEESEEEKPKPVKVPKKRGRKPKAQKVTPVKAQKRKNLKKEKDANEPKKPLSAYALFFRDTQAAIKGQNSSATFGEISKIVASMWEALDPDHKNVYKKKNEAARKVYLKAMEDYKAGVVPGSNDNHVEDNSIENNDDEEKDKSDITDEATPASTVSFVPLQLSPSQLSSPVMDYNNTQIASPPPATVTNYTPVQERSTVINHAPPQQTVPTPDPPAPEPIMEPLPGTKCIRNGCTNLGIQNSEWEDEYCSSDCVMLHCKDVFNSWVDSNKPALRGMS